MWWPRCIGMESWHCYGGRAPQNNSNSLLQVADMVRASGRRISITLGIITFEIDTTQTSWVHGSKFDLKILEEMVRSAQWILK